MYKTSTVLYHIGVKAIDVSTARASLAEVLDASREGDVVIERYGKPAGVLISPERHKQFLAALEELDDVMAFDEAMAEEGPNIPWDEVKAELGWA
jgi:prevent-host-death family protein